jgi:uncharacterized membrane protein YGL010W
MALFSTRTWDDWISEYARSHRHPVNRMCHTIGIPLIALSIIAAIAGIVAKGGAIGGAMGDATGLRAWLLFAIAGALFVVGWIFQFVGHAFERKPPEFLKDWRFLFVGLRWWFAKVRGRAS